MKIDDIMAESSSSHAMCVLYSDHGRKMILPSACPLAEI
jgi:hypothetical protein